MALAPRPTALFGRGRPSSDVRRSACEIYKYYEKKGERRGRKPWGREEFSQRTTPLKPPSTTMRGLRDIGGEGGGGNNITLISDDMISIF